jgi:hypothetical protein
MRKSHKRISQKLEPYVPHPHQVTFHKDTHKFRMMVSGVGAGKTRMGVEECIKYTQLYPGSFGLIGRLNATNLRETTQKRFFECCPKVLIEDFNKNEGHVWVRTNKTETNQYGGIEPVYSEILFKHMEDAGQFGSLDISYFYMDEIVEPDGSGEIPVEVFEMLDARLRYPIGPHKGFGTTNSGGKNWVWDKFFNPKNRERYKEYVGWQIPTSANAKYLPPNYVEDLARTHSSVWVKRFLEGSFDAFEGQIWVEFDDGTGKGDGIHTFNPEDFEISPYWSFGSGFDFGITAPTATVLGAVDQDNRVIIYDEIYEPDANIPDYAIKMKQKGITHSFSDPAVSAKSANKKSPKEMYQEEDVFLIPASNDEDFFMTLFRSLLKHPIFPDGKGKIIISTKCHNLISQIKAERWAPATIQGTTHDKVKTGIPNHARDGFKYFLNTYGLSPELLNPLNPRRKIHTNNNINNLTNDLEDYMNDSDIDDEDYPHKLIQQEYKRKMMGG